LYLGMLKDNVFASAGVWEWSHAPSKNSGQDANSLAPSLGQVVHEWMVTW